MTYIWEIQDVGGIWHEVTEVQWIAYRLDGVPTRVRSVIAKATQ